MQIELGFFVRPDPLDFRDRIFAPTLVEVPSEIPLARYQQVGVPVLSQMGRGVKTRTDVRDRLMASTVSANPHSTSWACTGFALATVVHYLLRRRETHRDNSLVSEAMLFEMARRHDDYTGDRYLGSSARGAMRGWHVHGVCTRDLWPFRESRKDRRLTAVRATDAATRPLGAYLRVNHRDLIAMHCALAEVGVLYAVVNVHRGWLNARKSDGHIRSSNDILGSHAVAIVAYDRSGFWVQNSWGPEWGVGGFGHIAYDDWLKNGVDTWVARLGVPTVLTEPGSAARMTSASAASRTQVFQQLRSHIVRVHPDGHLQSNDVFGTSEEDLDTIFEEDFPAATRTWKKKRLLLYAGGGLAPIGTAVQRGVADYRATLMQQGIYPLAFIGRTDFWDTISTIIRRALRERQPDEQLSAQADFMLDRLDDGLEPLIRELGGKLQWDEIKRTAAQATAQSDGAVRLTLDRVAALVARDPSVEVHMVGHSAGALLLAPAVQLLTTRGAITSGPMRGRRGLNVPVTSCSLWAPACPVSLFDETFLPAIERERIKRFLLITLTEELEASDNVAGIYRKSLLHLISAALEDTARVPGDTIGTPLVGMETFIRGNAEQESYDAFLALLKRRHVTWLCSPSRLTAAPRYAVPASARRHGDFDDDPGTLTSALGVILSRPAKDVRLALNRSASSAKALRLSL